MTRTIMFAGGGTGGHLFPAFAIADEFQRRLGECNIRFFVTGRQLEMDLIKKRGYPVCRIHVQGIKRGTLIGNLLFPVILTLGIIEAAIHILRHDPDFVIGTGGYLSFPAVLAAKLTNRPAFIQEQNSYVGIASRKLARFADLIFIAYEEAAPQLRFIEKCILSGNPIDSRFGDVDPEEGRHALGLDPDKTTLLIVGGSQGAQSINEKLASSLDDLAAIENIQVLWQVGRNEKYIECFDKSGVTGKALRFIDDMPSAYAAADLVICRAGALTISEITATGRPAIIIPYPHATDDHQTKNAQSLVKAGAAVILKDADLPQTDLVGLVRSILADESELLLMGMAAAAMGTRQATESITQRITEYMGWR